MAAHCMSCKHVSLSVCRAPISITTTSGQGGGKESVLEADAVVLAVGIKAIQGIVRGSPDLAACPSFAGVVEGCVYVCVCLCVPVCANVCAKVLMLRVYMCV